MIVLFVTENKKCLRSVAWPNTPPRSNVSACLSAAHLGASVPWHGRDLMQSLHELKLFINTNMWNKTAFFLPNAGEGLTFGSTWEKTDFDYLYLISTSGSRGLVEPRKHQTLVEHHALSLFRSLDMCTASVVHIRYSKDVFKYLLSWLS
jgi:hypothetical protein